MDRLDEDEFEDDGYSGNFDFNSASVGAVQILHEPVQVLNEHTLVGPTENMLHPLEGRAANLALIPPLRSVNLNNARRVIAHG